MNEKKSKATSLGQNKYSYWIKRPYYKFIVIKRINKEIGEAEENKRAFVHGIDLRLKTLRKVSKNMHFLYIKAVNSPSSLCRDRSCEHLASYHSLLLVAIDKTRLSEDKKDEILKLLKPIEHEMSQYEEESPK